MKSRRMKQYNPKVQKMKIGRPKTHTVKSLLKMQTLVQVVAGTKTVAELAGILGMDVSNQNHLVLDLLAKGFLKRDKKKRQHNRKPLEITGRGKQVIELSKEWFSFVEEVNAREEYFDRRIQELEMKGQ